MAIETFGDQKRSELIYSFNKQLQEEVGKIIANVVSGTVTREVAIDGINHKVASTLDMIQSVLSDKKE
jgi:hypothetical protein